jgi:membrane-associated protease RseP (regulator of RpoE activity)
VSNILALVKVAAAAGGIVAIAGCANPYAQFYQPHQFGGEFEHYDGPPRLASSSGDLKADVRNMYEQGYGPIGASSFVAPPKNQNGALDRAKKVGAAVVIVGSKYQSTVTGVAPVTTPTTSTAFSNGTASAYGAGGSAFGTYSGTTTTYGTQTEYVPYSVDRYDQWAVYFAPLARRGFGALVNPMTDEQRRATGTNRGLQILALRKGSPAYEADILPGDLLLKLGDKDVDDIQVYHAAIAGAAGRTVDVEIFRDGKRLSKQVTFPPGDW